MMNIMEVDFMVKLIAWLVAGCVLAGIAGMFPSVAVMITAIVIVGIFVLSKWLD